MDLIDTLGAAHAEELGDATVGNGRQRSATVGKMFLDLIDLPETFPKVQYYSQK